MFMETIVGTFSQSFWNSQIHGIKDIDVRDIEIQIVLGNCDFFCRLVHRRKIEIYILSTQVIMFTIMFYYCKFLIFHEHIIPRSRHFGSNRRNIKSQTLNFYLNYYYIVLFSYKNKSGILKSEREASCDLTRILIPLVKLGIYSMSFKKSLLHVSLFCKIC